MTITRRLVAITGVLASGFSLLGAEPEPPAPTPDPGLHAGRLLIARADFPERHAWLVTGALVGTDVAPARDSPDDPAGDPLGDPGISWHPGSRGFLEGRPEPGDG